QVREMLVDPVMMFLEEPRAGIGEITLAHRVHITACEDLITHALETLMGHNVGGHADIKCVLGRKARACQAQIKTVSSRPSKKLRTSHVSKQTQSSLGHS